MIAKVLLNITNLAKPILLKIFPYKILRKLKNKMIINSFDKLKKVTLIPYNYTKYPQGINLIGNVKATTGLGQSVRLLANEIIEANVLFSIYQYNQLGVMKNEDTSMNEIITNDFPYGINIIHINPHDIGLAFMELGRGVWDSRYNIAFWLWELEEFPDEWLPCFNIVNEIWTPSEFISNSIRKKTNLPVVTVPYHINVDIKKKYERDFFGLPKETFLYLMMYDSGSIMERKNPIGVLQAFKKAFDRHDKAVGLVIKINNYAKEDEVKIKNILDGYTNIYFITETLDRDMVNSLIEIADVYVSLHRAEGFGLTLAEAMLLKTPVIATNWSSNIEFMNSEVACMVDAKLIELTKDYGPFKKGNHWADPDLDQAAEYMSILYHDNDFRNMLSNKAYDYIVEKLSMKSVSQIITSRLKEITNN